MKDIHSDITVAPVLGPEVLSADKESAVIDLQGYAGVELLLSIGQGGITFDDTNSVSFALEHSDEESTHWGAVDEEDVLGCSAIESGVFKKLTSAHAKESTYRIGYVGNKRYLKVKSDFSGTHGTGTAIAVTLIKGFGHNNPQADQC